MIAILAQDVAAAQEPRRGTYGSRPRSSLAARAALRLRRSPCRGCSCRPHPSRSPKAGYGAPRRCTPPCSARGATGSTLRRGTGPGYTSASRDAGRTGMPTLHCSKMPSSARPRRSYTHRRPPSRWMRMAACRFGGTTGREGARRPSASRFGARGPAPARMRRAGAGAGRRPSASRRGGALHRPCGPCRTVRSIRSRASRCGRRACWRAAEGHCWRRAWQARRAGRTRDSSRCPVREGRAGRGVRSASWGARSESVRRQGPRVESGIRPRAAHIPLPSNCSRPAGAPPGAAAPALGMRSRHAASSGIFRPPRPPPLILPVPRRRRSRSPGRQGS